MDREGFVEIIKLDPSSSLVSMRLSAVRKLSSRTSERNGDRVHVATRGYDSEVWSELQLASLAYTCARQPLTNIDPTDHSKIVVVNITHQGASATTVAAS